MNHLIGQKQIFKYLIFIRDDKDEEGDDADDQKEDNKTDEGDDEKT